MGIAVLRSSGAGDRGHRGVANALVRSRAPDAQSNGELDARFLSHGGERLRRDCGALNGRVTPRPAAICRYIEAAVNHAIGLLAAHNILSR